MSYFHFHSVSWNEKIVYFDVKLGEEEAVILSSLLSSLLMILRQDETQVTGSFSRVTNNVQSKQSSTAMIASKYKLGHISECLTSVYTKELQQ